MIVNGINEWLMLINHSQCSTSGYFHPLNTKHHHSKATLEAAGDLLPVTVEMMGDYAGDMKILRFPSLIQIMAIYPEVFGLG